MGSWWCRAGDLRSLGFTTLRGLPTLCGSTTLRGLRLCGACGVDALATSCGLQRGRLTIGAAYGRGDLRLHAEQQHERLLGRTTNQDREPDCRRAAKSPALRGSSDCDALVWSSYAEWHGVHSASRRESRATVPLAAKSREPASIVKPPRVAGRPGQAAPYREPPRYREAAPVS
jgi:hypothetical protein